VRFTVGRGKQATPATLKAGDPEMDLGLLTAPGLEAVPAPLGKTARLKVGDPVYAVGAPQGLELSLSEGIVSQLRGGPPPIIQTTVAISQGSSGGGLFNAAGELVGITTFYLKEGQNLNFALPVEWIAEAAVEKIRVRPRVEALGIPAPSMEEIWSPGALAPSIWWKGQVSALEKAQDWQGLLAWCRRWTQAEPGNEVAWYSFGVAYGDMGRHREAIAAYREALRLKPDYAPAWNNLGVAYALSGKRSAALEAVKELRRYDPQKADELFNLIMKP
jgi:hypothetical protein